MSLSIYRHINEIQSDVPTLFNPISQAAGYVIAMVDSLKPSDKQMNARAEAQSDTRAEAG